MAGAGRIVQLSVSSGGCPETCGGRGAGDHTRHPGWSRVYARVLAEGRLRPGDGVRIVSEPTV